MQIQNYIFQAQNAIFQTLKLGNIGVEVVMNRGQEVVYPQIMIALTKKTNLQNGQVRLETEVRVITQDFSPVSASTILQKVEDVINILSLQSFMNFYIINAMNFENSSVFANEEGFFCGSVVISMVVD